MVQTEQEIQDMIKPDSRIEIVELVLKNLVPKFSNNKLKYDPHQIMSKLRIQNNGSFKKLHSEDKKLRHTFQFMKLDAGPHKLTFTFLENLECTSNFR